MSHEKKSPKFILELDGRALPLSNVEWYNWNYYGPTFCIEAYMEGLTYKVFSCSRTEVDDPEEFFKRFLECIISCDTHIISPRCIENLL